MSYSSWGSLVFMLALLLIVVHISNRQGFNSVEGFSVKIEGFTEKRNHDLYDHFYSTVYDYLVFSDVRNEYEVGKILDTTHPTSQSIVLDIGSGTGNVLNMLNKRGIKVVGVDLSQDMINKTIEKFPDLSSKMVNGNVLKSYLFPPITFTHVLCMYFTVYYIQNKQLFFENVYDWLLPGGYFVLHLVNRDKFSPLLPMNSHKRRNKTGKYSKIRFNDFDYESDFKLHKEIDKGYFTEKFKTSSGTTRKQEHQFFMEEQGKILNIAQKIGFIVNEKIDMSSIGYENQYLYILTKPN